jgi:proteasome accessory factor C
MLPWLQERGTVSTTEMAAHFGMSVDDLIADLTLASLCGVSQDPRDLIDLWVDEDAVHFGIPKYFNKPLRLTAPEAFSLVASARAARNLTGAELGSALDRAVVKVARSMGIDDDELLVVELESPPMVKDLAAAAAGRREVVLDYWTPARGESQERRIVPVEVFAEGEHWYVRSFDIVVGEERTFRLDRIESFEVTSATRDVEVGPRREWFADETTVVTLEMDPSWMWVLEQYPGVTVDESRTSKRKSWVIVTVKVTNERWLQRLLLRLGSNVRVLSPTTWSSLAADTAREVRRRYSR